MFKKTYLPVVEKAIYCWVLLSHKKGIFDQKIKDLLLISWAKIKKGYSLLLVLKTRIKKVQKMYVLIFSNNNNKKRFYVFCLKSNSEHSNNSFGIFFTKYKEQIMVLIFIY